MISFVIHLPPQAQMRARSRAIIAHGKPIAMTYKDPAQRLAEDILIAALQAHRPPAPLQGPLCLGIKAYLPIPASKSKKWQLEAEAGIHRPVTKPDFDNLGKHLADCMTASGYWIDDRQVIDCHTRKYYSFLPRWEVWLSPLDQMISED